MAKYKIVKSQWGSSRDIPVNLLDCDIFVSEIELELRYQYHFRIKNFENGMNPWSLCAPSGLLAGWAHNGHWPADIAVDLVQLKL